MIDRPWMTALEMQFKTYRWMITNARPEQATPPIMSAVREIIDNLAWAAPFSWADDITKAVEFASRAVPSDATLDMASMFGIDNKPMWWWFNTPIACIPSIDLTWSNSPLPLGALLISQRPTGIEIARFSLYAPREPRFSKSWTWDFGDSIDTCLSRHKSLDGRDEFDERKVCRFLLAGIAWINQRIISIGSGHVERHRRKQFVREATQLAVDDVKVIQLRRRETASALRTCNNEGSNNYWSYRWIVNGHWRNQPYREARKLIYIMPFIKGPSNKPLKVPTHTVYQVSR